jgi:hypothetical protein
MSRMIRRILIILVLGVAVLLVVGDRLAVSAAQHAIAVKARNAAQLKETPSVTITGTPFLTQAVGGRYKKIKITAHDIHRGGIRIETVHAEFSGVHVSLSDALDGKVSAVPIDKGVGDFVISYPDLTAFLTAKKITVTASGSTLTIDAKVTFNGAVLDVHGTYDVGTSGQDLVFSPVGASLRVNGAAVPTPALPTVVSAMTVSIDTGALPFGLKVASAHVTPDGVRVDAAATGLVVPVPDDASRS